MDSRHVSKRGKTPMSHLTNRQKAETMPIGHTDRTVFPGVVYVSVQSQDKINFKDSLLNKDEAYKNIEKSAETTN